jgi:hypothetical protein
MPRLRTFTLGALLAAALTATLGLPGNAWSQFRFRSATTNTTSGSTSTDTVALVALGASSNTIAGPANFTDDTTNPEQNVIYETFGGAAVDVCLTVQNRGQLGDVKTVVDGAEIGDKIRPRRTRSRCFTAPTSIELRCTSSLCDAVWRIDAI